MPKRPCTQVGAVVLSDYAKGTLTPRVIRAIIDAARRYGKPVVVDPKGHDYSVYRGATLITPNRQELGAAVHRPVTTEAEIGKAAAELARLVESEAVLVTRSEEGMTLHIEGHAPIHIPAYPVKMRDVSGAGDTVAAVMAVLLAMQAPFESAMRAANAAAAVVVGKRGTATVSLAELRHRILPAASLAPEDKIVFDGRRSTSGSPSGASTACASASPMAVVGSIERHDYSVYRGATLITPNRRSSALRCIVRSRRRRKSARLRRSWRAWSKARPCW